MIAEFASRSVAVIGLSVDLLDEARKTRGTVHRLTFPLGYGVDGPEFASRTGAFFDVEGYLQATGFILQPDGLVAQAVYSTGPVGRYTASDVISLIDYLSKNLR